MAAALAFLFIVVWAVLTFGGLAFLTWVDERNARRLRQQRKSLAARSQPVA
jgi:hypothetical protein